MVITNDFDSLDLGSIPSTAYRGVSSNGRAIALHAIGREIDTLTLQKNTNSKTISFL